MHMNSVEGDGEAVMSRMTVCGVPWVGLFVQLGGRSLISHSIVKMMR